MQKHKVVEGTFLIKKEIQEKELELYPDRSINLFIHLLHFSCSVEIKVFHKKFNFNVKAVFRNPQKICV